MSTLARIGSALALCSLLALAAGAQARPEDRFLQMLLGIDTVPSRQQLESYWPDARARMLAAAKDDALAAYPRQRAISMLAQFPDEGVRVELERLAAHADADVRYEAVYTLARTFGNPGDARLVDVTARALDDSSEKVRRGAIRALGWVTHPNAEQVLAPIAAGADRFANEAFVKDRLLAQRSLARRAKLAKAPDVVAPLPGGVPGPSTTTP